MSSKTLIILAAKDISQNRRIPLLARYFANKGLKVDVYAYSQPHPNLVDPRVSFHKIQAITLRDRFYDWLERSEKQEGHFFRPRSLHPSQAEGQGHKLNSLESRLAGYAIGTLEALKYYMRGPLTRFILMTHKRHINPDIQKIILKEKKFAPLLKTLNRASISDQRRIKFHQIVKTYIAGTLNHETILLCHDRFSAQLTRELGKTCGPLIFDLVELIEHRSQTTLETRSAVQLREITAAKALVKESLVLSVADSLGSTLHIDDNFHTLLNGRERHHKKHDHQATPYSLGFSGTFFPDCGLKRVLNTLAFLPKPYHLHLVGQFASKLYRLEILALITELQLTERVRLMEKVDMDGLRAALIDISAYILPFHAERPNLQVAMPNRLFDALCVGVPIVAQTGLYLTQWVIDKDIGYSIDYSDPQKAADAILKMMKQGVLEGHETQFETAFEQSCHENQILELDHFLDGKIIFPPCPSP